MANRSRADGRSRRQRHTRPAGGNHRLDHDRATRRRAAQRDYRTQDLCRCLQKHRRNVRRHPHPVPKRSRSIQLHRARRHERHHQKRILESQRHATAGIRPSARMAHGLLQLRRVRPAHLQPRRPAFLPPQRRRNRPDHHHTGRLHRRQRKDKPLPDAENVPAGRREQPAPSGRCAAASQTQFRQSIR